jgi:hypothetical protein
MRPNSILLFCAVLALMVGGAVLLASRTEEGESTGADQPLARADTGVEPDDPVAQDKVVPAPLPTRPFAVAGPPTVRVRVIDVRGDVPSRSVPVALVAIENGKARLVQSAETQEGAAEMEWEAGATHVGILGFVDPPILAPIPLDPEGTHDVTLRLPECGSLRITVSEDLPPGARVRINARFSTAVKKASPMLQVSELDVPWVGRDVELWPVAGHLQIFVEGVIEKGYVDQIRLSAEAVASGRLTDVCLLTQVRFIKITLVDPEGAPLRKGTTIISGLFRSDGSLDSSSLPEPDEEGVIYRTIDAEMAERLAGGVVTMMAPSLSLWVARELPSGVGGRNTDLGLTKLGRLRPCEGVVLSDDGLPVVGATVVATKTVGSVDLEIVKMKTGPDGGFRMSLPEGPVSLSVNHPQFTPSEGKYDVSSGMGRVVLEVGTR